MDGIVLRSATGADAEEILAIYGPLVESSAISFELDVPTVAQMRARIERTMERHPWIVASRSGRIAGYAYATEFRARQAYAWTAESAVYVHAAERGLGLGRHLMEALTERLRQAGFRTLVAGVTLPNEASVALHRGLGFAPAGRIPNAGLKFDRWHDLELWTLDLAP